MLYTVKHKIASFVPALQSSNYRLFFMGQGISLTGSWMQSVAEQWLVYPVLTSNKSLLGIISAVNMIPTIIFVLFAGVLVDRINKRRMFIVFQIVYAVIAFVLYLLIVTKTIQLWHIFCAAFVGGVVFAFEHPTRQTFMMDLVEKKYWPSALSLSSALFNSARALGPAAAGIVIASLGIAPAYLINSISFFAVIISLFLMKFPPRIEEVKQETPFFAGMKEGLQYIKNNKIYLAILAIVGIMTFFTWPGSTLQPVFAHDIFKKGEVGFGFIQSFFGIGAMVGGLTFSKVFEKLKKKYRLLYVSVGVAVITMIGYAWAPWFWFALLMQIIAGWAISTVFALNGTLMVIALPGELRGRVLSIYTFVFMGFMPFGALLASLLVDIIGPQMIVTICAIGIAISVSILILLMRGKFQEKIMAMV
ncbi:MAG: MFS transporter [Candidatus Gottesmanbacteria bacterium]